MGFGRVQRRPEIDALRGVFLVWMTLAHLPTHLATSLTNRSASSPLRKVSSSSLPYL
jgi:hypothetical protein